MTDKIRLSSNIHSWESCIFKVDEAPFEGLTSVKLSQKRERKLVYGMKRNGKPIGKTAGKYIPGLITISMLRDSYEIMTSFMSLKGLGSYGDAECSLFVQYVEPLSPPITIIGSGCTIEEETDDNKEGVDELTTEVSFLPTSITRNGKALWSLQRSIP